MAFHLVLFTHCDYNDNVTISDFPADAAGAVIIPAEIAGMPVTSIGSADARLLRLVVQ
jgi:hypothetical protein